MSKDKLTIRSVRARPVNVPMALPLQTSGGAVTSAPLVLVDLATEEGPAGRSYIFCYAPFALTPIAQLVENLGETLKGDALAPLAIEDKLQRTLRLLGYQGFASMALAGIDMAAWDAMGQAAEQPLVRLLGGAPRPIPAYNSKGLGIIGAKKAGAEASALLAEGFRAVKVRLGYPDVATDVAVVRAVRQAVGEGTPVMSDYNQSLSVAEAQQRLRRLDAEGLYWVEEPTRFDDYAGHAAIREKAGTPIQLGENCWGPHDMARALEAGACDYFMIDVMKIGGITGWLRAAALAEARGIPVSSHLFPEVSAHLLAITPTAHWLEYVDWANPILQQPLAIKDGNALIPDRPGIGLAWDEKAVAKALV